MSSRTRQRVRRGPGQAEPGQSGTGPASGIKGPVIQTGDYGTYPGPQEGDQPGAEETGDLDSREFGVPQADIPGGKRHFVSPQAVPAPPVKRGERPADYHKYHGVAPTEPGQYVTPPTEDQDTGRPRQASEPHGIEAVPVYIQQGPGHVPKKRVVNCDSITVPVSTAADPIRICGSDLDRVTLYILNEDQATDIRFGDRATLLEGRGALLTHFSNSFFEVKGCQDELFALTTSTSATARLSVVIVTEVPER
jgi:hypothetical protein